MMLKAIATLVFVGAGVVLLVLVREVTIARSQVPMPCFLIQERDRLMQLAHEGVDDAFKEHVKGLFGVWVRDPAEQPKRAMTGMAIGLSAYHRAKANIRAWEPEICK